MFECSPQYLAPKYCNKLPKKLSLEALLFSKTVFTKLKRTVIAYVSLCDDSFCTVCEYIFVSFDLNINKPYK